MKLFVYVFQDRNDIPPVFTAVPRPVTLDDSVPIGTTVMTLIATDSDGTSPGNKVNFHFYFFLNFILRSKHKCFPKTINLCFTGRVTNNLSGYNFHC